MKLSKIRDQSLTTACYVLVSADFARACRDLLAGTKACSSFINRCKARVKSEIHLHVDFEVEQAEREFMAERAGNIADYLVKCARI